MENVRLGKLELSDALRQASTAEEVAALETWVTTQRHTGTLREAVAESSQKMICLIKLACGHWGILKN